MSDKKLIVDLAKGTQTYVDLTPEEIEQRAVDAQAAAIEKAERDAEQAAKAEAKAALLIKLGITADEAKLLLA